MSNPIPLTGHKTDYAERDRQRKLYLEFLDRNERAEHKPLPPKDLTPTVMHRQRLAFLD